MDSELLATCGALGYLEDDKYYKDPDCLNAVKSLIRYLHHEEDTHENRVQLGAAKIVSNDLLPLLCHYSNDENLCSAIIRLIVNLTQPALLCFGNKIPKDANLHHQYLKVIAFNQSYKEDFANEEILKVLSQKVYDILEKDWEDRTPDDSITVERILILFRNLLHVPATNEDIKQTVDDNSSHDRLLKCMYGAGLHSLILYLANSTTEQEWCLHVVEIISLMLKEQNVDALVNLGSSHEQERLGSELMSIRKDEEKRIRQRRMQQSSRHSRFGGTFVAKGQTALYDQNELILHKPLQQLNKVTFDEGKNKVRKPKNRRPLVDTDLKRHSTVSVRKIIKEFCIGFLDSGYNHLMYSVKDRLSREKSDENDETYYFTVMSFMMEFNRKHNFQINLVSETAQLQTLHFINVNIINDYEFMLNDKQEGKSWGHRMHMALKCYLEFLLTMHTMDSSSDSALRESARVILSNVFYMSEYREIFLTLLRKFDETKQTKSFLSDLIQTTHLFIKLFEKYSKSSTIVVEKRLRKKLSKNRRKRSVPDSAQQESLQLFSTDQDKANCWNEIENEIRNMLQNEEVDVGAATDTTFSVFDPTSDIPEEEQQQQALKKIQSALHNKKLAESLAYASQARRIWPESNIFGTAEGLDDKTENLKEICLADLRDIGGAELGPVDTLENDAEEEDDDDEEPQVMSREVEISFMDYIRRFADYKIVQPYALLLSNFESNSVHLNHCIAKMLHRVCYDLKMYGILFQASVFVSFRKIFSQAKLNKSLKELEAFAKFIVRKFFEILPDNEKLFAELLFWKQTTAEVYELSEGYGSFSKGRSSKTGATWNEEEKEELERLYKEFCEGEDDVIDCILSKIINETRSRRQIRHQLIEQGLVADVSELKRKKGGKAVIWREHEEEELKALYEEYRSQENTLANIMQMMTVKKSKVKVIEKLLALGLVQERKELYKRKRKPGSVSRSTESEPLHIGGGGCSDEDDVHSHSESEGEDDDGVSYTELDLASWMQKVSNAGFKEQISWVKSSLDQALEDRVDSAPGDVQSIPLVPLTEEQENAMSNSAFRNMIRNLGLQRPSSEQEMFWRIPKTLTSNQLEDSIKSLTLPIKRKRETSVEKKQSSDSTDLDKQAVGAAKENQLLGNEQSLEIENEENKLSSKSRQRINPLSDDEDDDHAEHLRDSISMNKNSQHDRNDSENEEEFQPKRRRKMISFDSDDDEDEKPFAVACDENSGSTTLDKEDEVNSKRPKRIIESDEEED